MPTYNIFILGADKPEMQTWISSVWCFLDRSYFGNQDVKPYGSFIEENVGIMGSILR